MEVAALIVGILALIPVGVFVRDRYLKKRHSLDVHTGNVVLAPVVSPEVDRNERLALLVVGLTIVNSGPDSVTLRDVELRYRFERKRTAPLESVPDRPCSRGGVGRNG